MTASIIDSLDALNNVSVNAAHAWFMQTCTSEKWCSNMLKRRPFSSLESLTLQANEQWLNLQVADHMQAFSGHPMIGDLRTLREQYANTKTLASNEQKGTQGASEATLQKLQEMNRAYLDKHGFIFIICATGLSAEAMLIELQKRLPNSTPTEVQKAGKEQIKITLIRINSAFRASQAYRNS